MTEELKFKVVFVGDSTVGKTSIIHKYLKLDGEIPSTVGATSTRVDTIVNEKQLHLSVWDTAGQETFRNLVPVYAKGANAAVIVFDQSNKQTYEHVSGWYSYLQQHVGDIIIIVVQNKCDLNCDIDQAEVFQWAEEHHVQVISTSAKDGTGISSLFEILSKALYDTVFNHDEDVVISEQPPAVNLEADKKPSHEKKGCC
ncbi:Ras family protein [Trichomonas vaginalis G3]|uniref:Ras family protein n=1 Tax=Trichomonas vaginalis (strain ATCC PRA-98 / G3) TaxID=412133 RepID=A2E4D7_TRIV3|nr:retrograde vesicle-mediated transport, Golgi to ER [Trichomonas vaginalis G3]EAY12472.1 Ras family protein [Trichomonas vaginalis G3]KAI5539535.1 retrograde vesicle-mediated transport, Golgi to ER [Trichomonas vaginalis G3]|eukprot:XP_001324695.1 Ras family protein [Trichomonas vaginalis G3]